MIFSKPGDLKYTDLCIYIDNKVQQESITDEEASICYEYIYHIIHMLAVKNHYFNKEEYYDEFSITLAGDVFHRLFTHPKLTQLDDNGQPKMEKLKSCLNYIKTILYGRKVAFEQSNYSQKYIDVDRDTEDVGAISTFFSYTRDNLDFRVSSEVHIYLNSITSSIQNYLWNNSPYKNNKFLMKNIYLSCVLSILNSLVFTQEDMEGVQNKYVNPDTKLKYIHRVYKQNRDNCVVLYHLNTCYKNYITVTVRKLFTLIGKEIRELTHESIPIPEDVLMNVSLMEIMGKEANDN